MPSAAARSDAQGWFAPAFAIVALISAARLLALAFNRTELFVDETQYWFWGQNLDFGYYSKPPLIGWLLRAVTELAGSDSAFWIRSPGAVLHAITALILGALAARLGDRRAAIWTAAIYVTLPFVAVGSLLISTDTVMAPFFAGALLLAWITAQSRNGGVALLAGACAGAGFMAKYAAVYLIPGLAIAALVAPVWRPGWRNALLMAVGFALVISPNVIWNLTHDLTTVEHTMDNAGWVRTGAALNFGSLGSFFASQFAVFGPLSMLALLWGYLRPGGAAGRGLVALSIPALAVVLVQALLDRAYANWAVGAYFAGTVLAVRVLGPRLRIWAFGVNALICLVVPLLTILAPWPEIGGKPVMQRYLGRVEMSCAILDLAQAHGVPVLSANRDILADLFHEGKGLGVTIYAPAPKGRARNYYEQMRALPDDYSGLLIDVTQAEPRCAAPVEKLAQLPSSGAWSGRHFVAYLLPAECVHAQD